QASRYPGFSDHVPDRSDAARPPGDPDGSGATKVPPPVVLVIRRSSDRRQPATVRRSGRARDGVLPRLPDVPKEESAAPCTFSQSYRRETSTDAPVYA